MNLKYAGFAFVLFCLVFVACDKRKPYLYVPDSKAKIVYPQWTKEFKTFQNLVSAADSTKVIAYFTLPFKPPQNEIWWLSIAMNTNDAVDKNKAFTEQDFLTHYSRIFSPSMVKVIEAIDIDKVFEKGKDVTSEKYFGKMYHKATTSYDADNQEIKVDITRGTPVKYTNADGKEEIDNGELNIILLFKIQEDSSLKIMPFTIMA